jgi:hypothetical protein
MRWWWLGVVAGCAQATAPPPPAPPLESPGRSAAPPAVTIAPPGSAPSQATTLAPAPEPVTPMPEYLQHLARHGEIYARVGTTLVDGPAADTALLRSYPSWVSKGALNARGERLTIMTEKSTYAVGEPIRVVHVHEATLPGVELYAMGPKAIYGEYVDGHLASPAAAAPSAAYDGAVLQSPNVDGNYEVSVHTLPKGMHTIAWRFATLSGPDVLASNILRVLVR